MAQRSRGSDGGGVSRGGGGGGGRHPWEDPAPSFAGGRRFNDDAESAEAAEQEESQEMWSAELIRRAADNIKGLPRKTSELSSMKEYEIRCANRQLVDLIEQATERSFGAVSPEAQRLVRSGGLGGEARNDFAILKAELDRILQEITQAQQTVEKQVAEISQCWSSTSGLRYTPLDLLDVMLYSNGAGAATSNLVVRSIAILHENWLQFAADAAKNSGASAAARTGDAATLGQFLSPSRGSGDDEGVTPKTAAALPAESSASPSAAVSDKPDETDAELSSKFAALLTKEFLVPEFIASKFFELLRPPLPPKVRILRLRSSIARIDSCREVRNDFISSLEDVAAMMGRPPHPATAEQMLANPAPELCDLAESSFLPRLKAFELASGIPMYIDIHLAAACRLAPPPRPTDSAAEPVHITPIFSKILKSLSS